MSEQKNSVFPDTPWSLLMRAKGGNQKAQLALGDLCQMYWYPVYCFARSRGISRPDAEDAVQGLFVNLLERKSFEQMTESDGRLRAYMLTAVKRFLISEWRKSGTQKRGGDVPHVSINSEWAESTITNGGSESDEDAFDRNWAFSLLTVVSKRLEDIYDQSGKRDVYEAIKGCLEGDGKYEGGEEITERLGMSREGIRSAVFKLRQRFRECVEAEVEATCMDEDEAREEIAYLCRILAR